MRKICERTAFLSHITLFHDYERAGELTVPVKVVICPKLILTQRFCPEEFPREVRIILSLFNYEDRAFEKLCLAHELAGVPFSYLDVFSQDPFAIEEGVLNVKIDYLPPLSSRSVIVRILLEGSGEYTSKLLLKECFNCRPEIVNCCDCARKI